MCHYRNLIILLGVLLLRTSSANNSKIFDSACELCVLQGKIFHRTTYPPSPLPFICLNNGIIPPFGYTVIEEISSVKHCRNVLTRRTPLVPRGFHQAVVNKLQTDVAKCKEKLNMSCKN